MEKFIPVLKETQMFSGVSPRAINAMLTCLGARLCEFDKGELAIRQGDELSDILVLVEGNLLIQKDDYWGNRSILGNISTGEIFGEAYLAPESGTALNDVVAIEKSSVICFDVKRILTSCSSACRFHARVVQNLFFAISEKNKKLVQKLDHMSQRSTREKLLSYLSEEAKKANRSYFTIPYNRQQLADFLAVDRSAMSSELGKLKKEGLLEFDKNHFRLL